jgi:Fe2+ transport system protein FeoA
MTRLSELNENRMAKIVSFDRKGISASQITELLELGFYPGADIECLESIPSLDKMIFLISGTKVGLRIGDCTHIEIQLDDSIR